MIVNGENALIYVGRGLAPALRSLLYFSAKDNSHLGSLFFYDRDGGRRGYIWDVMPIMR